MHQTIENKMEAGMLCAGNWLETVVGTAVGTAVEGTAVGTALGTTVGTGPFDEALDLDDSVIDEPILSLFIPRVFPSVTENNMKDIFHSQQLGHVNRVDFVEKIDKFGKKYKNAYIHFNEWYVNKTAEGFRARVCAHPGAQARIVYDDPWYWTVLENTYTMETPVITTSPVTSSPVTSSPFTTTSSTTSQLVPTQLLKRALGLPTTTQLPPSSSIKEITPAFITNLVSEDYVKHIEEMNADLLDRIQLLETKLRTYENRDSDRDHLAESAEQEYFELLRGK